MSFCLVAAGAIPAGAQHCGWDHSYIVVFDVRDAKTNQQINGDVRAIGSNANGQPGDGTGNNSTTAVEVINLCTAIGIGASTVTRDCFLLVKPQANGGRFNVAVAEPRAGPMLSVYNTLGAKIFETR
ncbi:MAG TPA: hypothetical protein VEY71_07240 [Chitinophagales bacterium]|nr:hypothetical protein [Chitinophagales bacterium]